MKIYKKLFVFGLVLVASMGFMGKVSAFTPTLTLSSNNGGTVSMTVYGDANSGVTLYYTTSYGTQTAYLGATNSSGYFYTTLNSNSYNMAANSSVYVMVNNQQSTAMVWPGYGNCCNNTLTLSQTSLSLTAGQTSYVTASNSYGTLYVSSNSNPGVATATINGNMVSVYGNTTGSTTLSICQSSGTTGCASVYVTVGGTYGYSNNSGLTVSSLNLSVGNSITLSSPTGASLYVSSNSNPTVATAGTSLAGSAGCFNGAIYSTVNGQPCYNTSYYQNTSSNSITIQALAYGTDTITICQGTQYAYGTTGNSCSTVYLTVNNTVNTYNPGYVVTNPGSVLGASTCSMYRTLRYGNSGADVTCLQTLLSAKGYIVSSSYNGYFDLQTKSAVVAFQQDHGLYPDGVVGGNTRMYLNY